ncbi:MAG: type IX secretion system membrane protein PorP/SprF [Bacteroidales bacterium]
MKKLLFTLFLLVSLQMLSIAQNDIQFSNYMFSEITYNPAMAGNSGTLDAALIARQQWFGFDQSPQTQLLNVHSYVDQVSGGVGLSIINDKLGFERSLNVKFMYSYKLKLSDKNKLAFGLGFGMVNRELKGSQLIYDDMTDLNGVYINTNKIKPDFDFGIAFNSERFFAGISSTHIEQPLKKATILYTPRHYYLYAKYKIKAGEKVNVIPSVKVRSSEFITQFDATALVYYANKFWVGASFRLDDAIVGLIGVDITKNFRVGYSYDYTSGPLKSYSSGSHEIMLLASFDVSKWIIPVKTPRFFD